MPTLTIEQNTTTQLAPTVKAKLKKALALYSELDSRYKVAKSAREKQGGVLEGIRDTVGEQSIGIEGAGIVTLVCGTTKKVNYKKLIALGCRAEWIDSATEESPKKPYTKITLAKDTEEED